MALLSLRNLSQSYGGPPVLDQVDLQIDRGERICLLGRNGEGKSTLIRLIAGEIEPDGGEILRNQGLRIGRLAQEVPRSSEGTIADVVSTGLLEDGSTVDPSDHRVQSVISRSKLDPSLKFQELSSGMKRRTLLAQALVGEPDLLLLDEPTNHLDLESIRWMEETLLRWEGTLLFITHDRAFLERLATRILELDRGRLFDWPCDYPTFLKRRDEQLAAEEKQAALFDKKLAQEEVWIRKGIQARRTRNEGRVRALKAMREAHRERRAKQGTAKLHAQEAGRTGTRVIEAENLGFGFEGKTIVTDLSIRIDRGDKVGIIGPNGAGKTTLVRLLLGELEPDQGTIRHGTNLEVAYFDQLRTTLDEEKTVQENVSDYETITIDGRQRHILGYLQDFLFAPDRSRTLVRVLSGGERSRVMLAKLFTKPSNVLVLDEPTNDLDIETLELLESLLVEYSGTILVVSHDRAFLNNVVTSTLAIEDGGVVKEYEGGFDDYVRQRKPKETSTSTPSPKPKATQDEPTSRPRKLSYKERRELEALPAKIETLETKRTEIHEAMAEPSFYQQESTAIAATKAELERLESELTEAYTRWEALEALNV